MRGLVQIWVADSLTSPIFSAGPDLSNTWERLGIFRFVLSNGVGYGVPGPRAAGLIHQDANEPYEYTVNAEFNTFGNIWDGLSDQSCTLVFDDRQNLQPVVSGVSATPDIVNAGETIALSGQATDPDAVPDTLALALTAQPNIGTFSAITQNGDDWTAEWTAPGVADDDRNVVIKMTATEPDESLTGEAIVNVTVRGNQAPVVTAEADQTTVDVGDTVNLTGTVTDPEGQPVTQAWSSDIGGTLGTPTALTSTWVAPSVTESTVATLTLTGDDGVRTRSATVTIIVRAPATQPLVLPAVSDESFATGDIVNLELPAASEGLAPYIYSAAGLPRGLTFRNRAAVGRPDLPGTYTVTYTVTDSNQDMVSQEFEIEITGQAIPQPTGLNVRIDWGQQFYANAHSSVYNRITGGIECFRGKNTASAVLGRSQAGTMSFELLNDDGLYDDENPDSDLAGLIYPGIQVQLRIGVSPIWTGALDSIPSKIRRGGNNIVKVSAHGVLSRTRDAPVSGGSLTAESTAQAFIELCAKGDAPYESPQPEPGDAYVMNRWWEVGTLLRALHVLEDTEGGFVFEDREGELGFHLAPYRGERTISKTFVVGTPGTDEIQIDGDPRKLTAVKDVHNVVQGDVRQFQTRASETVYESEIAIPIALGGRLDLVSVYPVETGAVQELDSLVAGTGWTANTAADGSGTDRTSQVAIDIELMDFNEIHITITYPTTGGSQADTLYIRDLAIEGSVLTVSTALQVTREDTISKQRYRPKTRGLRNTWIRSVVDMENRAEAILDVLASPERRIQVTYLVEDWADFLALDLSGRVRLELPNLESDAFIESVKLSIRRGDAFYSTVNLSLVSDTQVSPAPVQTIWEQFEALTDALGIEFTASANLIDLYEFDPAEGTLLNSTTGQFSDDTIIWLERIRVTSTDLLAIHRGASTVDIGAEVSGYDDTVTLYIVNETTEEFIALQANDLESSNENVLRYSDATWTRVGGNVTSGFATWLQGLVNDTVLVGLANDATWEPYS